VPPRVRVHLWGAAIFGVVATAVATIACLLIIGSHLVLGWAYPRLQDGSIDQAGALGLQLAFGQVWFGGVTLFLAAALGYLAIREFAEQRAGAVLWLELDPSRIAFRSVVEARLSGKTMLVSIVHDSPTVVVWYQVSLHLPHAFFSKETIDGRPIALITVLGTVAENWRFMPTADSWVATFLSNGANGVFRGSPQVLCEVVPSLTHLSDLGEIFELPYTILSDQSDPLNRSLKLTFVQDLTAAVRGTEG
jgi:hypothetical protein